MTDRNDYQSLRVRLAEFGQEHVLQFWDELDPDQRSNLYDQLAAVDLNQLAALANERDAKQDFAAMAAAADSPPSVRADGSGVAWSLGDAAKKGTEALKAGIVGVVLVAGGQGTRLGFNQPKGMFPIGPVSRRSLFQFFADRLIAINHSSGVRIPLYVMTSDATDAETQAYFRDNDYLGLPSEDVMIFQQGTMPAVDSATGKLLLAAKDSLALSPDGHGGTVAALENNACFADMRRRGIQQLSYIQVDNPLAHLCDPVLIGHHLISGSEMTTEVIRKRYPTERVGNVVMIDGSVQIIEYSDLPDSAAEIRTDDGELKLWAGSIAVHMLDVQFLERMRDAAGALPFHRASKKVAFVDCDGQTIEPDQPNATKFEWFIFDLLPQAKNAIVVEVSPSQAFAPVKNADGAETDTPSLAMAAISDLHRAWLEQAGVSVAPGVRVEINPRFSLSSLELAEKISANLQVDADHYFADRVE